MAIRTPQHASPDHLNTRAPQPLTDGGCPRVPDLIARQIQHGQRGVGAGKGITHATLWHVNRNMVSNRAPSASNNRTEEQQYQRHLIAHINSTRQRKQDTNQTQNQNVKSMDNECHNTMKVRKLHCIQERNISNTHTHTHTNTRKHRHSHKHDKSTHIKTNTQTIKHTQFYHHITTYTASVKRKTQTHRDKHNDGHNHGSQPQT